MRGRPAHKTYLLARQLDMFSDERHQAQLEKKYPYLRAMRMSTDTHGRSVVPGARPQPGEDARQSQLSAQAPQGALLGNTIRNRLSTSPQQADEAEGA